jgi:hypothetical protein
LGKFPQGGIEEEWQEPNAKPRFRIDKTKQEERGIMTLKTGDTLSTSGALILAVHMQGGVEEDSKPAGVVLCYSPVRQYEVWDVWGNDNRSNPFHSHGIDDALTVYVERVTARMRWHYEQVHAR